MIKNMHGLVFCLLAPAKGGQFSLLFFGLRIDGIHHTALGQCVFLTCQCHSAFHLRFEVWRNLEVIQLYYHT